MLHVGGAINDMIAGYETSTSKSQSHPVKFIVPCHLSGQPKYVLANWKMMARATDEKIVEVKQTGI